MKRERLKPRTSGATTPTGGSATTSSMMYPIISTETVTIALHSTHRWCDSQWRLAACFGECPCSLRSKMHSRKRSIHSSANAAGCQPAS